MDAPASTNHPNETLARQGMYTAMAEDGIDVTLIEGDLEGIVRARRLSQHTMTNIEQNLFFAFIYNMAALSLSSVIVNALRLRYSRVTDPFLSGNSPKPIVAIAATLSLILGCAGRSVPEPRHLPRRSPASPNSQEAKPMDVNLALREDPPLDEKQLDHWPGLGAAEKQAGKVQRHQHQEIQNQDRHLEPNKNIQQGGQHHDSH